MGNVDGKIKSCPVLAVRRVGCLLLHVTRGVQWGLEAEVKAYRAFVLPFIFCAVPLSISFGIGGKGGF